MTDAATDRRGRLLDLVERRGFVRVVDASALLAVSEVTVRADLTRLERDGAIVRTHGGAVPARSVAAEFPLERAVETDADVKRAIGERVAELIAPGQSVLLDVGSTALAVAHALVRRTELDGLTVITNGLSIALALEAAHPRITVVVTGGTLRPLQHSLVNPLATELLAGLNADLAVIGCNGVDAAAGVTNLNLAEAEVKRRMMDAADRRIVVADGSKLGQRHLGAVAPVAAFESLVTGGQVQASIARELADSGLEVIDVSTPR